MNRIWRLKPRLRTSLASLGSLVIVGLLLPSVATATPRGATPRVHVIIPQPQRVPGNPNRPVSETARSADGKIRCKAVFPSRKLEPGFETGGRMSVKNATSHEVTIDVGVLSADLVIRDANGDVLDDTGYFPLPIPAPVPRTLEPRERLRLGRVRDAAIRWEGALSIEPVCNVGHRVSFDALSFRVDRPQDRPSRNAALTEALGATGGLFDKCRPDANGDRTIGSIAAPLGPRPSMDAKCWAHVAVHVGFDVVDLSFLIPPDLHATTLPVGPTFGQLPGNKRTAEQARFGFVVSSSTTTSYDSVLLTRTRQGSKRVGEYELRSDGPWRGGASGHCGGGELIWGRGVFFVDVSACPA
jgi:hypothetical protein